MNLLYERAASSASYKTIDNDTSKIREWRSIITLIVFVLTSKSLRSHSTIRATHKLNSHKTSMFSLDFTYRCTSPE
jgi:hypothetical protein